MNEEQINTFLSIIKHGSFSGAAHALYMSQPAVTHRIKTLEDELGVALFIRDSSRAVLTPAGNAFIAEAQSLRKTFRHARDSMLAFSQNNTIRIGFPSVMLIGESKAFFAIMKLAENDEKLQLHSVILESAAENTRKLLEGEIDLVFSAIDPAAYAASQFGKRVLFHCTTYACVHKEHRWAGQKEVALDELKEELIYRYHDTTHFSEQFNQMQRELALQKMTADFDTITQALAQLTPQQGVVLTNGRWVTSPGYVYLPLKPNFTMRIGMIWLRQRANPALRLLIQRINELPQSIWRI